jgi:hypothetical protein
VHSNISKFPFGETIKGTNFGPSSIVLTGGSVAVGIGSEDEVVVGDMTVGVGQVT